MDNLTKLDLISPLKEVINQNKPFLGLCLGLQLLMTESEEFGSHKGLDIIDGTVNKFKTNSLNMYRIKVPQVGWNQIFIPEDRKTNYWAGTPLNSISNGEYMYFVHSFYINPSSKDNVFTITSYENTSYCSGILKNNLVAFQFHPEKSSANGLKIYRNWADLIKFQKGTK